MLHVSTKPTVKRSKSVADNANLSVQSPTATSLAIDGNGNSPQDEAAMNASYSKDGKAAPASSGAQKWYAAGAAAFILVVMILVSASSGTFSPAASLAHLRLDKFPETFRIAVIADLDQSSKKADKNQWSSIYITGTLRRSGDKYSVSWDAPAELTTSHNEAGRGCELSELVRYDGKLYTFDDRTGIMFEVVDGDDSSHPPPAAPKLVPRAIFMEGDGSSSDKGMKVEWATVKDGTMIVGSFGKEFTNNKGEILHANNLWTVAVHSDETVAHVDWRPYYGAMRQALGYGHPGYLLHEAVAWSPHHRKWYVFPRRVSREAYDDVQDEKRGSNMVIVASHDFSSVAAKTVGTKTPERGFSSVKFLPGSRDSVVIALKSEENAKEETQHTYLAIYQEQADGSWATLLEETPLPVAKKFEGIEILAAS